METVLSADGEALCSKIFEAEQANLHAEPLVGARVLGRALALAAVQSSTTAEAARARSHLQAHLLWSACGAADVAARAVDLTWIGGGTHQKDIYTYVIGSLATAHALLELSPALALSGNHADLCRQLNVNLLLEGHAASAHPQVIEEIQKLIQVLSS
jgi:hypothetical protein